MRVIRKINPCRTFFFKNLLPTLSLAENELCVYYCLLTNYHTTTRSPKILPPFCSCARNGNAILYDFFDKVYAVFPKMFSNFDCQTRVGSSSFPKNFCPPCLKDGRTLAETVSFWLIWFIFNDGVVVFLWWLCFWCWTTNRWSRILLSLHRYQIPQFCCKLLVF